MSLKHRDEKVIWHPFTQHQTISESKGIVKGQGVYLFDESGKSYLDMISSWWVNIHGHCQPTIAAAIYQQALTLEHVIFSGFTHEPAVKLGEELLKILPSNMEKVFYSDNGSTAVEVALKMVYQYWKNQGVARNKFIAFDQGYHGDTFGAMAVGKQSHYFNAYEDLLFNVNFFPYPETWESDNNIEEKERLVLNEIENYLIQFGNETAGIIIEPLIQGASGMRMCRPQFLQALEKLSKSYGVLTIYDEVMTGFGRTGELFSCLSANTQPDIICLAKGLTGGFLPLAATVCSDNIYQAFLGETFSKALAHGHSFTANPLGCAAALASLTLLKSNETQEKIRMIINFNRGKMKVLNATAGIEKIRSCGTVLAFNLKATSTYGSAFSLNLRNRFAERGLLIRPLGNVIYFLPPYCITQQELEWAFKVVIEELEGIKIC